MTKKLETREDAINWLNEVHAIFVAAGFEDETLTEVARLAKLGRTVEEAMNND